MAIKKQNIIGTTIGGRFLVKELIGEGGMGEVFMGIHQPIGTQVAIKVLKSEHASDDRMVARFRREVRSTTRIQQKNIVQILDSGQLDDGRLYLVMEYIQGQTLVELLDEIDTMDVERAMPIFIQIADGISAAHKIGIMHRDLKPENILRLNSEKDDVIKILDFGLARMVETDTPEDKITLAGEIFGTPIYMSPEQCLGGELDLTTDIYSFGILAYECLTGGPPFEDGNIVQIMLAHKNKVPEAPSAVYPEAKIPKELDDLILKCLAKMPGERFQSGMELATEIRKVNDLIIRRRAGAPEDLPMQRRLPSVELNSIGSGSSLTPGEVYSMVHERLRERLYRIAEILREYNFISPSLAVSMAQISTHENEIVHLKQEQTSKITRLLEEEDNLQQRTAQLRIAVQDLSYDRELLARSLTHNPNIKTKDLKMIFPYLDEVSAPENGSDLMEDVSFQITSLEKSIHAATEDFDKRRVSLKQEIEGVKLVCASKERDLVSTVNKVVEELLGPSYYDLRKDANINREFSTLEIFYKEAKGIFQ